MNEKPFHFRFQSKQVFVLGNKSEATDLSWFSVKHGGHVMWQISLPEPKVLHKEDRKISSVLKTKYL